MLDVLTLFAAFTLRLYALLEFFVRRVDRESRKVLRHSSHARAYRHLVVVEDDYDLRMQVVERVEGLEGDAVQQGAVADHGDDLVVLALQIARLCIACRGGYRRAAVPRREKVVWAVVEPRKAGEPSLSAQRFKGVHTLRQNFIRVALMPDVEDNLVGVGIENAQKRYRKLHSPERRAQMPAVSQ